MRALQLADDGLFVPVCRHHLAPPIVKGLTSLVHGPGVSVWPPRPRMAGQEPGDPAISAVHHALA
jgi:hypothetical protein